MVYGRVRCWNLGFRTLIQTIKDAAKAATAPSAPRADSGSTVM